MYINKMKLNLFKLFILLVWPFATASAADVNMKFGKPTKEEMQMTTYEADPNADAVVGFGNRLLMWHWQVTEELF